MPMTLLASATPSFVDTVTFSNIPATHTHLEIWFSLRFDGRATADDLRMLFNGSSTTDYNWIMLRGTGQNGISNTSSSNTSFIQIGWTEGTNATSGVFGNGRVLIPDYAASNNKAISAEHFAETAANDAFYMTRTAGLRQNTAAINSVRIFAGSTFAGTIYVYGIS